MKPAVGLARKRKQHRVSIHTFLIALAIFTAVSLFILTLRSVDPSDSSVDLPVKKETQFLSQEIEEAAYGYSTVNNLTKKECASVEEMGEGFRGGFLEQSVRVRRIIRTHFDRNGASRVRSLPPEQFCRHKFVLGKASEAGFGNEMYKILTGAALSIMLDRSLIIGQSRHIGSLASLSIQFINWFYYRYMMNNRLASVC